MSRQWFQQFRRAVPFSAVLLLPFVTAEPTPANETVAEVFARVARSVVVIRATGTEVRAGSEGRAAFKETGSGVLVSADGKVLTAAHVVHGMDEIVVEFLDGTQVKARMIAAQPDADLAVIQVASVPPTAGVPTLADSDKVRIGDPVMVVGAPYGLGYTLSVGHVSARHAPFTVYQEFPMAEFFQTDATINTGNSGGPMFNQRGEVIGVVSHIISKSGGSEGLGFVATINSARRLVLGRRAVWLGIEVQQLPREVAELLNVPDAGGVLVKTIVKGSPAAVAGIRGGSSVARIEGQDYVLGGDVILAIAGRPITRPGEYAKVRQWLSEQPPGTYTFKILRVGHLKEVPIAVPDGPEPAHGRWARTK